MKKFIQKDIITRCDLEQTISANGITGIDVAMLGGNIVLLGSLNTNTITIKIQWDDQRPLLHPRIAVKNGILAITARQWAAFFRQKNAYILEVHMPADLLLNVRLGAGTIFATHLSGDCNVRLGAGDAQIQSSGKLLQVRVGAGDVKVSLQNLTDQSNISLRVGLGDISVHLPTDVTRERNCNLKNGLINNSVGAQLEARIGLGDIKVTQD